MSNSRNVQGKMMTSYGKILEFMTYPSRWALGCTSQEDTSCDPVTACCRSPVACVGEIVTVPTGIAAAAGVTLFGCTAMAGACLVDAACPSVECCGPSYQSM